MSSAFYLQDYSWKIAWLDLADFLWVLLCFFPRKAFEGKVAFKKDLGEDYSATRLESVPREYALKRSRSSHCSPMCFHSGILSQTFF